MHASGKIASAAIRPITIVVEGNIASGKTQFLNRFRHKPGFQTVPEPVDKWRNIQGHNGLELMYADPKRWSLTFQTYVQLTMLDAHTNYHPSMAVKMMERSIYSAKYCFVENLYKTGNMPPVEYAVLSEWFNWIITKISLPVDLIIYLQTDPVIAHKRIAKRCRNEESTIPLDYMQSLHNLHEDWLINQKFPVPAQILVLDANKDMECMDDDYEAVSNTVDAILSKQQHNMHTPTYQSNI